MLVGVLVIAGTAPVALANADTSDTLRAAVSAARSPSCGPLRYDPVVQLAAEDINEVNNRWLDHAVRAEPPLEALPLLKDLGYQGNKSAMLIGSAMNEADSIKALLLQGWREIPDCSFRDYGGSVMQANTGGWIISVVVLAA